jgi:sRNA-binding regulator protein Hfq
MTGHESRYRAKRSSGDRKGRRRGSRSKMPASETGSEALYLRSLVDSGATVTVVLMSGEELVGKVRYYDRNVFSLGLIPNGPNVLVWKHQVLNLQEQPTTDK